MVLLLVIILIYSFGIFILAIKFSSTVDLNINKTGYEPTVSLLIPFKNEAQNLDSLISDLGEIDYPKPKFEIIFINDNSTDGGETIISNLNLENVKLINLEEGVHGKKQALKKGLEFANGDVIIHTDADVRLNKNWIWTYVNSFIDDTVLVFGSVIFYNETSVFEKLQSIELLSLTGIAASAGIVKTPILMSGANFAYRKELKQDFVESINSIASGDDMFFLERVKKLYHNKTSYVKHPENIVKANAERTLKSFFNQRVRWAGKTKNIKDYDVIISGILSFLANFIVVVLFVLAIFNVHFLKPAILFVGIKFLFEFVSLLIYAKYFNKLKYLMLFPILFLLYPFYITIVSVSSMFIKPNWK